MAFPTVNARTTTANAASLTHSVNLGTPVSGELLVVICTFGTGSPDAAIDRSISGPGWWQVAALDGAGVIKMVVFAKIAAGGDALTVQIEASIRMAALCYRITGHGSSVAASTLATASGANADPSAVSQSGSAQDTLFLAFQGASQFVATVAPAGYGTLTTASSTNAFVSIAEKTANATSDDPAAFTNASNRYIVGALAISSTAITTNARPTQVAVESLSQVSPNMVVTQTVVETLTSNVLNMAVSQVCVEMLSTNVADDVTARSDFFSAQNPC